MSATDGQTIRNAIKELQLELEELDEQLDTLEQERQNDTK